ncbi:Myb-like DNA-binding protein BAS1 [Candida tropicalis]
MSSPVRRENEAEISDSSSTTSKKRVVHIDPLAITESLGFRIFRKGGRKPWTKEEDSKLVELVQADYKHPIDLDQVDWDSISEKISPDGSRKGKDCRKRWTNSLDPSLRKGKWTKEEDEALIEAYKKHGASWLKVSSEISGRTDDQCAKRYMEVLDPSTKNRLEPWSMEEDLLLIQLIKKYGTKWRTICNSFDSRPALTCRNRWRKLVTDVVRGKADPLIKKEVEKVTNATESDSSDANILEVLSKQQEELTKMKKTAEIKKPRPPKRTNRPVHETSTSSKAPMPSSSSSTPSETVSRSIPMVTGPSKTDIEWRYTLAPADATNDDSNMSPGMLFEGEAGGVIKNEQLVKYLVSYAKMKNMNVTVHQHIHHHYAATSGHRDSTLERSSSVSTPAAYNVEPEDQQARFQHFNYLPPLVQVPKLNSSQSSPNNSSQGDTNQSGSTATQFHHHHHHHHHHHTEKSNRSRSERMNKDVYKNDIANDFDGSRESDIMKLLNNTEDFSKQREATPGSNPLTPLTQAVEYVEAENKQNHKRRKLDNGTTSHRNNSHQLSNHNEHPKFDLPSEDEEGLDFWETMRNLTDIPYGNPKTPNKVNNISENVPVAKNSNDKMTTSNNYSQKPVSQHHPLHYYNSSTRENTPHPMTNLTGDDEEDEVEEDDDEQEEGLDDEDKVLAREVEEVGVDQETLNSYGLFYNVYTREGSTFPDIQHQTQAKPEEQGASVYDQWGGGFGIIPFNPS